MKGSSRRAAYGQDIGERLTVSKGQRGVLKFYRWTFVTFRRGTVHGTLTPFVECKHTLQRG